MTDADTTKARIVGAAKDLENAITDGYAERDEISERLSAAVDDRKKELLSNPKKRNLKIWATYRVDKWLWSHTPQSITKLAGKNIDDKWAYAISGLICACFIQARDEIAMMKIISSSDSSVSSIKNALKNIDRKDLLIFGKTGISKTEFKSARERRGAATTS